MRTLKHPPSRAYIASLAQSPTAALEAKIRAVPVLVRRRVSRVAVEHARAQARQDARAILRAVRDNPQTETQ